MTDTEIINFMDKHRLSIVVCDGSDDFSNLVLAQYTLRNGTSIGVTAPTVREAVQKLAKEMGHA